MFVVWNIDYAFYIFFQDENSVTFWFYDFSERADREKTPFPNMAAMTWNGSSASLSSSKNLFSVKKERHRF